MDNLTHSLFGATLARTPLGRAGRGTTVALVLASNAPDVDIVTLLGGSLAYLEWHRGPTHGPLGIVGLGLLTAALVSATARWLDADPRAPRASFPHLARVSIVGVLLHVLMDLPTTYGTRSLSPFDWTWFAVDWMPIIDVYLLAALGAGLWFGNRSGAAGRRNAAIVLALMAVNYGIRGAAHHRAIAAAPDVFGPLLPAPCPGAPPPPSIVDYWPRGRQAALSLDGRRCLLEIAAIPTFGSPFQWRLVAQLSNAYELHDLDLLVPSWRGVPGPQDTTYRRSQRHPNHWTPAVRRAAATRVGEVFLGFSRFPAAHSWVDRDGFATVRWTDLRFSPAPPRRDRPPSARDGLFTAFVRLSPQGEVIEAGLGR
jgi:membrane-bound metal-dependent hydrolase YbcI (DUF457 family)